MIGMKVSLLVTDVQSVHIDTLNVSKLLFEAVNYENFKIEREPESFDTCRWRYSSATEDMNDPVTRS